MANLYFKMKVPQLDLQRQRHQRMTTMTTTFVAELQIANLQHFNQLVSIDYWSSALFSSTSSSYALNHLYIEPFLL